MLVIFTNLSLMESRVTYLALFCLLSVIDGLKCYLMGSLQNNIQLMLVVLKAQFLAYHISCYISMDFLMLSADGNTKFIFFLGGGAVISRKAIVKSSLVRSPRKFFVFSL